jgi:hypothetical protein
LTADLDDGVIEAYPTGMRIPLLIVLAALALGACDRQTHVAALQSPAEPTATNIGVRVPPATLDPRVIVIEPLGFVCPILPAFAATFRLTLREPAVDMFLNEVRLQLGDGSGRGGQTIPIPSLELARRFGSTRIGPGSTRSFDFAERFDCFTALPTTLVVALTLVETSGMAHEQTMSVPVVARR